MITYQHKDLLRFYFRILGELIILPFLCLWEQVKKLISSKNKLEVKRTRKKIDTSHIKINVHEWGGYPLVREKKVNVIPKFNCGLRFQLERFTSIKNIHTDLYVTISDIDMYEDLAYVKSKSKEIISVSNIGMDFSGYAAFYEKVKDDVDSYIILSNSSVNSIQTDFLEGYLDYMDKNLDVGILGISYSGKMRQTLVRNNFTPHLQSFFLLTTTSLLREIVDANGGKFPGSDISHKLLLIREGEIKISQIALKLGYNLAVVLEDGNVAKFGNNSKWDNGYNRWNLYNDDVRLVNKIPNLINPILRN